MENLFLSPPRFGKTEAQLDVIAQAATTPDYRVLVLVPAMSWIENYIQHLKAMDNIPQFAFIRSNNEIRFENGSTIFFSTPNNDLRLRGREFNVATDYYGTQVAHPRVRRQS